MAFEFRCAGCGEIHRGTPGFTAEAPLSYYDVPVEERAARCSLGADECVIDGQWYFVRGCLEIPVLTESEPFIWGVWVSLSERSFSDWRRVFDNAKRSHVGPFFGWLNAALKPYPSTENLKTHLHLRDDGIRPYVELEPTEHPLAIEQRQGISVDRVNEIYAMMHAD